MPSIKKHAKKAASSRTTAKPAAKPKPAPTTAVEINSNWRTQHLDCGRAFALARLADLNGLTVQDTAATPRLLESVGLSDLPKWVVHLAHGIHRDMVDAMLHRNGGTRAMATDDPVKTLAPSDQARLEVVRATPDPFQQARQRRTKEARDQNQIRHVKEREVRGSATVAAPIPRKVTFGG
jgi:hypothetical protein